MTSSSSVSDCVIVKLAVKHLEVNPSVRPHSVVREVQYI